MQKNSANGQTKLTDLGRDSETTSLGFCSQHSLQLTYRVLLSTNAFFAKAKL